MRIYDHVHVDWAVAGPNDPGYKYGGSFYGDCWESLFAATVPPEPPFDTIYEYPFYDITGACAGVMYQNPQWGNWRQTFHELWKKLGCKIRPYADYGNKIGIMIRSDVHGGEQLSGRSQPLEEYAQAIEAIKDIDQVVIVSSDIQSIYWMQERLGTKYWTLFNPEIKRNLGRSDPEQHINTPQTKEDAIAVVREIVSLATCKAMVHPASNMATAALYINPNLQSIYLK